MPFEFVEVSKDTILAKSTIKNYKALLNKLSKSGYTTQKSLIDNDKDVIKRIKELYEGKSKRETRVMVCAVFYILCDTEFIKFPNAYYDYFQDLKEPTYTE
jgi:predicted transcriptional regulator